MVASSRDMGWTSLLVDHDRIVRSSEEFETNPTPDQTIVVMLQGVQKIEVWKRGTWQGASYRAGTVGMTAVGQTDKLRRRVGAGGPRPEKAVLYLPSQFVAQAADHYRRAGQQVCGDTLTALSFEDPAIAEVATALLRGMSVGGPDFYAESTAWWLASHLLASHGRWESAGDTGRDPGPLRDGRLERVLALMTADLGRPLRLDDLAAEAGVSKFHFTRLFRQKVGLTPLAYLLERRLDAASRLLEVTDLSVAAIATRCGFVRATHFATAFARRYGKSPSLHRRFFRA